MSFAKNTPKGQVRFLQQLLDKSRIGTWEYCPETDVIKFNKITSAFFPVEASEKEIIWKEYLDKYCYPDDSIVLQKMMSRTVSSGSPFDMECRIISSNEGVDDFRWFRVFGWHSLTEGNKTLVAGALQDIDEKVTYKNALQKTREAEDHAQLLIDASPLACNIWDENLVNIDCNKEALKMFSFEDRAEYLKNFIDTWPKFQPDGSPSLEKSIEFLRKAFESGYERFEWMQQDPKGDAIPCEITLIRVKYGDRFVVAAYSRDLRESKAHIAEIEQAKKNLHIARDMAEQNARAKSEFLANMSHEIRTPMNAIIGMLHLLLKTNVTSRQQYYLEKADQSAKALLRIINDILDFSKIEAGKLEMEKKKFELEMVLKNLSDLLLDQVIEKKLDFLLDISSDVPSSLLGDSLRLGQIITNLVSNALKFTTKGSIQIDVSVYEQKAENIKLLFVISDTGIGMSQEQAAKLFAPFSQADNSVTRKFGGTGLGLAISKTLVNLMGGDIWCESEENKGSKFFFTAQFPLPKEQPSNEYTTNLDVLLLGDNIQDLANIRFKLQILRCRTNYQRMGQKATSLNLSVKALKDTDIILMDWSGAGKAFYKTMQLLESKNIKKPVILALPPQYDKPEVQDGWNIEFLYKPATLSGLYNSLMNAKGYTSGQQKDFAPTAVKDIKIPKSIYGSHILLAEDNEINQFLALELLTMKGFIVDIANNGKEALKMLERDNYDLVLMDIQMPEMDGLTAAKKIRENTKHKKLPILAMTANAMSSDKDLSLKAGMNDHIAKPIEPVLLYNALIKWIKTKK